MASGVVLWFSMDRGCASLRRWNGLRGSGLWVRSLHRVGFLIEFWLLGGPRPPLRSRPLGGDSGRPLGGSSLGPLGPGVLVLGPGRFALAELSGSLLFVLSAGLP